ncbi:hypothetical protein BV25DRAFT_1818625 [Artomyces pyxidatus]|uniref:Uncharacterized protein n=1 Tax=Artomyces pyxidatus TaxID=48021 RepID=A0ACB8TIH4_9AGAM|nr:hypothetical protein BV25DRAFT_1818625 [Artomyces pyxidatus]
MFAPLLVIAALFLVCVHAVPASPVVVDVKSSLVSPPSSFLEHQVLLKSCHRF